MSGTPYIPPRTKPPIPTPARPNPPAVKPRVGHSSVSSSRSTPSPAPMSSPPVPPQEQEKFGSCLQTCYDAINKRHEEELKALESLRVHISSRARADREYADSLAKINQRANRSVANISQHSAIVQAWKCFLEVSEDIQKQVSNGAAQMSSAILQTVDQLIKDKRGAKKVFDTDRVRLDDEYHHSCTEVQNLRRDYQRYLQATDNSKRKLETSLTKEQAKPQEQEKYRKRFVSCADKLHSCHNNYCIAILNTNAHQDNYRGSLLPFCLDTLQERMELQITQWKESLLKYAQAMDMTQTYEESFRKVYESLRQVEMEEEYVEFIKENKKDTPAIEHFTFDNHLLQGYCSPKVEGGEVAINNLTHNSMKSKLASLESDLEAHERDIAQKHEELQELIHNANEESSLSPAPSPTQIPKHVRVSLLKGQVKDLVSKQERKQGQAALIRNAVDKMEDGTAKLFDPLGSGVDVNDLHSTSAASASSGGGKKSAVGTLRHGMKGLKGFFKGGRKTKERVSHSESQEAGFPVDDVIEDGKMEDSDSDTGSLYDVPPELPIEEEEWFFGEIDRKLSEAKCTNRGDYLVRYSSRQNKYVLTCNWLGQGKHFVIQQITDEMGLSKFRFESKAFPTIRELLEYHVQYGTAVTRASGAVIQSPVTRFDKWSLRHDDVHRGKRIGKGCFGDVYEGVLSKTGEKVAVKTCRSDAVQDMDKFLKEADILKQYDHPNIVKLIGICAEKEPVYIVMELMPGGAFLDYLRRKGTHQTKKKLCSMVVDAAKGMAYLESKNCIHRDLAARNCLVGDDEAVKISDFGMSREEEGGIYTVSSGTRAIPIKWTAPEALNYGKYTSMSDMWSFGILLWETFSCGSAPYPGMNNHEARTQVEVGYRMPPPADCPQSVYDVMSQCWQEDPEERPTFAQIVIMLQDAYDRIS